MTQRADEMTNVQTEQSVANASPMVPARRAFLGDAVRKAAFAMPVIWTLTAQQARAAGSNPSGNPSGPACMDDGELCTMDSDCCSGNCIAGICG
jgi:hypothetical protein